MPRPVLVIPEALPLPSLIREAETIRSALVSPVTSATVKVAPADFKWTLLFVLTEVVALITEALVPVTLTLLSR